MTDERCPRCGRPFAAVECSPPLPDAICYRNIWPHDPIVLVICDFHAVNWRERCKRAERYLSNLTPRLGVIQMAIDILRGDV